MRKNSRMRQTAPQSTRRRRKEARPAEILEAGLAVFGETGFAGTTLDAVARRAGIAKGTIYLYFPSKEALFEAAVRDRLTTVLAGAEEQALGFEGSTRALLRLVLSRIYERIINTSAVVLFRIVVGEGQRFPELAAMYRRLAIERGMTLITRILDRGVERGEIRRAPAATEPRLIVAPALMAALWTSLFQGDAPMDRARFLEAHLDLLLNGLFVPGDGAEESA